MVTAEMIAARATKYLRQPVSPEVVKAVNRAAARLRVEERAKRATAGPEYIKCVCGCGQVFPRRHVREKIHPACRERVYRNKKLLALCKGRTPVVVPASRPDA